MYSVREWPLQVLKEKVHYMDKDLFFTVKGSFHDCLTTSMGKPSAINFLRQFWGSDLCQDTVVPDEHWQQQDRSQGLAKEQTSVNFPANSFYPPNLICKGINFSAFLPENGNTASFQAATSRLCCQMITGYPLCHWPVICLWEISWHFLVVK